MAPYRGVIFDIDSNDAHARAWVQACADEGFEVELSEVRPLIGMGGDQLVPHLTGIEKDDPIYTRLSDGWKQHVQNESPNVQAQPGVRALPEVLQARGLHLIVETSADEALVRGLLKVAHVEDLLTEATTASDVEASKPEPDIVQAAGTTLGLTPKEVLMVGDTPFNIESVRKAGVDTVALRCGGDHRFAGAVAVYDSPQDWLDHLSNPPLGQTTLSL